jgi:NADH-quinone oxidoreductase subunit K
MISLTSYLIVSLILFLCGIIVVIARKNIIAILIGMELILNAAALNFVAYTRFVTHDYDGHIFPLFIIIVAAAEATVGLAIVIRFFQIRNTIHIDDATQLQS